MDNGAENQRSRHCWVAWAVASITRAPVSCTWLSGNLWHYVFMTLYSVRLTFLSMSRWLLSLPKTICAMVLFLNIKTPIIFYYLLWNNV